MKDEEIKKAADEIVNKLFSKPIVAINISETKKSMFWNLKGLLDKERERCAEIGNKMKRKTEPEELPHSWNDGWNTALEYYQTVIRALEEKP